LWAKDEWLGLRSTECVVSEQRVHPPVVSRQQGTKVMRRSVSCADARRADNRLACLNRMAEWRVRERKLSGEAAIDTPEITNVGCVPRCARVISYPVQTNRRRTATVNRKSLHAPIPLTRVSDFADVTKPHVSVARAPESCAVPTVEVVSFCVADELALAISHPLWTTHVDVCSVFLNNRCVWIVERAHRSGVRCRCFAAQPHKPQTQHGDASSSTRCACSAACTCARPSNTNIVSVTLTDGRRHAHPPWNELWVPSIHLASCLWHQPAHARTHACPSRSDQSRGDHSKQRQQQ
jgi:hypothetical protein